MVALQPVEPLRVASDPDELGFCLFGEADEVRRMATTETQRLL